MKFALLANELNHQAYPSLKAKARAALVDWLTYTPGEQPTRYFAPTTAGAPSSATTPTLTPTSSPTTTSTTATLRWPAPYITCSTPRS